MCAAAVATAPRHVAAARERESSVVLESIREARFIGRASTDRGARKCVVVAPRRDGNARVDKKNNGLRTREGSTEQHSKTKKKEENKHEKTRKLRTLSLMRWVFCSIALRYERVRTSSLSISSWMPKCEYLGCVRVRAARCGAVGVCVTRTVRPRRLKTVAFGFERRPRLNDDTSRHPMRIMGCHPVLPRGTAQTYAEEAAAAMRPTVTAREDGRDGLDVAQSRPRRQR